MITTSLYVIEQELKNLFDNLDHLSADSTEEDSRIQELNKALSKKADQVATFRESLDSYVGLLESKITELKNRKESVENKIQRFDDYVSNCMAIQNKTEFSGELFKIKKRKPALSVLITDETKIPIEFIKIPEVKPTIMKAEIAKLLKQGEIVNGAELVEGKVSVQYSLK